MTRLICFPCAGGKASFFSSWEKDLPTSIELCAVSWSTIENRSEQALSANYSGVVATLAEAIRPLLDRPFALYGHSLGSLVAYEIGYYGGRPLVERYGRWILMGRRELDWADRFFQRWARMRLLNRTWAPA